MRAFSYARLLLVTSQRWWSHYSICHIRKPHATCRLHGCMFIEPELLPIEVLHYGNRDSRSFCSCNLELDPITFIYELDPYSQEIYRMCRYELSMSRLLKMLSSNRHDQNYITCHFAGGHQD